MKLSNSELTAKYYFLAERILELQAQITCGLRPPGHEVALVDTLVDDYGHVEAYTFGCVLCGATYSRTEETLSDSDRVLMNNCRHGTLT